MSIFDKKEEVLSVELTSYGKKLLASGAFRPKYYTFHDDQVIYDVRYTGASEELINLSHNRIVNTPHVTPIPTITSVNENMQKLAESANNIKNKINTSVIGNSSLVSKYAPSWNIKIDGAEIKNVYKGEETGLLDSQSNDITQIVLEDIPVKWGYIDETKQSRYIENIDFHITVTEENVDDTGERFEFELFECETPAKAVTDPVRFLNIVKKFPFDNIPSSIVNNIYREGVQFDLIDPEVPEQTVGSLFDIIKDRLRVETKEKMSDKKASRPVLSGPLGDKC